MSSFCEHGNEPSGSMKKAGYCLKSSVINDFSKDVLYHGVGQLV